MLSDVFILTDQRIVN